MSENINLQELRSRELTRLRVRRHRLNLQINAGGTAINNSGDNEQSNVIPIQSVSVLSRTEDENELNNSEILENVNFADDNMLMTTASSDQSQVYISTVDMNSRILEQFDISENTIQEEPINFDNNIETDSIVENIIKWALEPPAIPLTRLSSLLCILKTKFPELPKTAKTLLQTNAASYNIESFDEDRNSQFVFFGLFNYLQHIINPDLHEDNLIQLMFNIDGLSLFKSSSVQFWPILCKLFHEPDVYKPFPVAIYLGSHKPNNLIRYFERFIDELNELHQNGITINQQLYNFKTKCFICDRPARSLIKLIKGHGGYFSCERCTVEGERYMNRTVYVTKMHDPRYEVCKKRTDTSFRNQRNPAHHLGVSPLITVNPAIDMINDFVLDSMHLVNLGVMKKLLEYWLTGNTIYKLSQNAQRQLSHSMILLQSQIPTEFQRTTRSLVDIQKFKVTEFQFILLYAGPAIFKQVLSTCAYEHFMLLHAACRILNSKDLALTYCNHAKYYLRNFVRLAPRLYGKECLIGTIHNLVHLADDVSYMGCPLSKIAVFPFEDALGKLKKMIRCGNKPLAQVCRRLHEVFFNNVGKVTAPPRIRILRKLLSDNRGDIRIKSLKFNEAILTTKSPNNVVLLCNDTILEIKNIYKSADVDHITIHGIILEKQRPIFIYPCNSRDLKMWLISKRRRRETNCDLYSIRYKMVIFDVSDRHEEKIFTMPLLHM